MTDPNSVRPYPLCLFGDASGRMWEVVERRGKIFEVCVCVRHCPTVLENWTQQVEQKLTERGF